MKEYKYSFTVVMPVYNVEGFLPEALSSLEKQTMGFSENIQLILVNDGSTDKSADICREFKEHYSENVIYIEKENGGVSSARNAGIPFIEGKYVNFLDSDDKWDKNAFKAIFDFFEEHYDETDVVSARVKKFDASEDWHVLDFKFERGSRVVDLNDEKRASLVQSHVSTAIIKSESVGENCRFDESVSFGEDSMFVNGIILRKLKMGIVPEAIYLYRKRSDKTSATQVQQSSIDYYTLSPEKYYGFLTEKSLELYNEVVPYVQNVLAYDIGWRVREAPSRAVLNSEELYESYLSLLRKYLLLVDEKYIIKNRVHKRIDYKTALITLRDGTDLLSETHFKREEEAIFYKDISLLKLQGTHKICHINSVRIKTNPETGKSRLIIEGLIAKWVLNCCESENTGFVFRVGKKKFKVLFEECGLVRDSNFFGEADRYFYFKKKITLNTLFEEKSRFRVRPCLTFSKKSYNITVNYGEKVNTDIEGKTFGDVSVICKKNYIALIKKEVTT